MDRAAYADRLREVLDGDAPAKVGYPIGLREVRVLRREPVGSALLRLTFGGPGLAGFHSYVPDEHVRLIFPDETGVLRLPTEDGLSLHWGDPRPVSREYTVRDHRPESGELDIDFVLHPGGLASEWAAAALPGTTVHLAGPPGGVVVPDRYDRYLFVGDITAVPAVARWVARLPRSVAGWVFLEVRDESEQVPLDAPPGVRVRWIHRGAVAPGLDRQLHEAVREAEVPAGERIYVWMAGETEWLRPLRGWVRRDLGVGRADCLIAGYWKRGVADYDRDE